ncbi:hypothetical protein BJ138DRAFT_996133 [Hygrophoropsis aurantiaca]|uniref:Uncharacterized protein n=1 Tax=Hygrophoropsis aurantiaca TaxID=72124 RepID=A0ACB8AU55_9AGAM|nr:hypothetical protein BJ138DRAFT_996133 [Hygrophoropsis aurantiaca]
MDDNAEFKYPGHEESDDEEFVYPGVTEQPVEIDQPEEHDTNEAEPLTEAEQVPSPVPPPAIQTQPHPSPAQLEALSAASSSGDLSLLKKLFQTALQGGELEAFALANDASSRTGYTALHAAASRGYLDIVKWLIEECGAMPDLEDREGEGYLDIVRWLCESGGAANEEGGTRGVDLRSNGGWTPLMNAASKGHLPVVLYLLTKQGADPLVRNNWGETAYDAAAAVFEVWICEVLQKAEAERWRGTTVPFNPLAVHTSVPLILYENQRLDVRLKTLAVSGGRPKFSASGLGKQGRRAPFELKLPKPDEETGAKLVSSWRSDVQLPLTEDPWELPSSHSSDRPLLEGAERSHFWLSDWTLDVTHPGVDAEAGWQYAQSFTALDEAWSAEQPAQLKRLLSGNGAMTAGLGTPGRSSSRGSSSSSSVSSSSAQTQTWVRRRRWVRVMRRRLDIPPLPFLEPDGAMYHLALDGSLIPCISDEHSDLGDGDGDGQELGAMPSTMLSSAQDYVARARYLVGNQSRDAESDGEPLSAIESRRAIAKLERATTELRQGILGDDDGERKTQAEVLLNAYSRELERRRLAAGRQGFIITGSDDGFRDDNEESDDEFVYPGYSPPGTVRASSIRSGSTDYFARPMVTRGPTDLTPHLSQAPEFRVPTRETPQKMLTPRWSSPTPYQVHAQWEKDETVLECRDCRRRFGFLLRRVCSCRSYLACMALLDPSNIVQDPALPETSASSSSQRVCVSCYDETNASIPSRFQNSSAMERIVVDQARLMAPGNISRRQSSSQLSDLADCPVCSTSLSDLGSPAEQESHVKNCLEGGAGATPQAAKYLVYKLPAESALLGVECVICLEEFVTGSAVARLSCLCSFHNGVFLLIAIW